MSVRRGGRLPKASDEAIDWCLEMKAVHQWTYTQIADGLLEKWHVASDEDPTKPVCVSAVRGYIIKGAKRLNKENYYRPVVQRTVHARMLDDLAEQTYALRKKWGECESPREWALYVDTVLKILKQSATLLNLDMQVERTEVRHTSRVPAPQLDAETASFWPAFEKRIAEERARLGSLP